MANQTNFLGNIKNKFKVYTSNNIFGRGMQYLSKAYPTNFINEINDTGYATIKAEGLDLNSQDNENVEIKQGNWIFIQNTEISSGTPTYFTDSSIMWWGFITDVYSEIAKGFRDRKQTINCVQIGKYLKDSCVIKYPFTFDNEFNPVIDGMLVKNMEGNHADYFDNQKVAINPESTTNNWWYVKDILNFLGFYHQNILLEFDYTEVKDNKRLTNIETISSYSNRSIIDALEEIVEVFDYKFIPNASDKLIIKLYDRVNPKTKLTYNIPPYVDNFQISSSESAYDGLVMTGDRILFALSTTTYGVGDGYMKKGWTDDQENEWITPTNNGPFPNIDALETLIKSNNDAKEKIKDDYSDMVKSQETIRQSVCFANKMKAIAIERERYKDVLSKYMFNYENGTGTIYTYENPGKFSSQGKKIPLFPTIYFQYSSTSKDDKFTSLLYKEPKIGDDPVLNLGASEMKFEKQLVINENAYLPIEPALFIRTKGEQVRDNNGDYHYSPLWLNASQASEIFPTYKLNFEYNCIRIEGNNKELFLSPSDDIFQEISNSSTKAFTAKDVNGLSRTDILKTKDLAACEKDPYRRMTVGNANWGRLVFSFFAYSPQKIQLSVGETNTNRVKYIEDPSYKLWIIRKGYVDGIKEYKTTSGQTINASTLGCSDLNYYTKDYVIKSHLTEMAQYADYLWNYYKKDKISAKIELPIRLMDNKVIIPDVKVGDYIEKLSDNGASINCNSTVASIEYYGFDTSSPRIIITTQYAFSPTKRRILL